MSYFQRTKLDNAAGTTINPATSDLQTSGNTSTNNLDTNLGAKADTSATTDTGTFSLISLFKRALEKITLLYTRLADGAQKTQVVDSAGHTIGAHLATDGDYHLATSIQQNIFVDTGNSSTANLLAGGTFTGVKQSTLGIVGIQIMLKTDRNCRIYIDQSSNNGTNWDVVDSFYYNSIADNFGTTVQAIGDSYRVRVTNLVSASATTYFRLSSVLCPMVEAMPRALTENGNLRTSISHLSDLFNFPIASSPAKDLRVCQPYRLVGVTFNGTTIDTNFWTATANGAAAANTQTNSLVSMASGTAGAGYANLASNRSARFIFVHPHLVRQAIRIPTVAVALNTRRWGAYTTTGTPPTTVDGVYWELSAAGVLSVNCRNAGGTVTSVASGSFNGTVSEYIVDDNIHAYEIYYFVMKIVFAIDDVIVHTFTPTTANLTSLYTLPACCTTVNGVAGSTSGVMEVWAQAILRLGKDLTAPQRGRISGNAATYVFKYSAGVIHKIIFNNTSGTTVTIYDGVSAAGTVIAIITTAATALGSWDAGFPFNEGLCIVTVGNSLDASVLYE